MKAIGVNILYAAPHEDRRRTRAWGRRLTASVALPLLLAKHGFVCSMSGKGDCWHNAVAERFFLSLKSERVW